MNTEWQVNIVTAYGRGESLALELIAQGFKVHVFDVTDSLPAEYRRGVGPFPLAPGIHMPSQQYLMDESEPLKRGMVLWLREGPVEFGGPMAPFYQENHPSLKRVAGAERPSNHFSEDWMRRFLLDWASPFYREPWQVNQGTAFPALSEVRLLPATAEKNLCTFDRYVSAGHPFQFVQKIVDVQIESGRLTEIEIESGQVTAIRAPQWVWCLSSHETHLLSPSVAEALFSRDVRHPEWLWMNFMGKCERGPWFEGFPEYLVALDDFHLPWVYANMFVMQWLNQDAFRVWVKVPTHASRDNTNRKKWASEIARLLNERFALGRWQIEDQKWSICPNSLIFSERVREWAEPGWKNWDWIAPETLPRLDMAARLEREAASLKRIVQWRSDQIKKQGPRNNDTSVHAP